MKVVSDSSPVIWLSKTGNLSILRELYGEVIIPWEVYEEVVVKGLGEGFSDALVVKRSVDKGWIRTEDLHLDDEELARTLVENTMELYKGDAHAVLLARRMGALLLMDGPVVEPLPRLGG
jgi:predicted nucleic acid-binding protein